jgi:F0F1-type ATP synthase assembly protein I
MAFQLLATLGVGAFIGQQLDARLQTPKPYLTALFVLLGLFAGLYLILKDLIARP